MKFTVLLALGLLAAASGSPFKVEQIKNSFKSVVRKVDDPEISDWWDAGTFYQIYPRSFKDSNNDGIGDLQGIIQKLDHLKDAGITGAWLSPIFKSPQVDQGYDISDYRDIDPDYGTLDDLKELLDKAHELGIKIILDFVPNHTSDQHQWFQDSVAKKEGFEDFYIWAEGKIDKDGNISPPNNWVSLFKGSDWTWNEDRQQYYLHQFASIQPDLNYRNEKVVQAMKDVLTYWLDFGVDGFRVDAVPFLFETEDLQDEPRSDDPNANPDDYEYLDHIYTKDLNETYDMIYQWRELLDNYVVENGGDTRIMMTEAYTTLENTMLYYGTEDGSRLGAHFTFNFNFITNLTMGATARDVGNIIFKMYLYTPQFAFFNWVLGNHDNHRVATRLGTENIDGFNMLAAMLPGISVTYNGEEIGQENGEVTCEEGKDPSAINNCSTFDQVSRDFERTPFQWDNTVNAGFNEGAKPWLPVSEKANETNLAAQIVDGIKTHYNGYKQMMAIRDVLKKKPMEMRAYMTGVVEEKIIQVNRELDSIKYAFAFNLDKEVVTATLYEMEGIFTVVVTSVNSSFKIGDVVNGSEPLTLQPSESIILLLNVN